MKPAWGFHGQTQADARACERHSEMGVLGKESLPETRDVSFPHGSHQEGVELGNVQG